MKKICLVLLALPAFAQMTTEQKVFDFQSLAGLYAKHYGPYDWKLSLFGFDPLNIAPWLDRVRATTNDLDFYDLMVEYVSDLHDGHDSYHTPSNFVASLGFTVDIYDGMLLIDSINRTLLPQSRYPFVIADELVSVDGMAAADLLASLAKYARNGNDRSTQRIAASRITTRPQQLMPHVVELGDSATVVVRRASGAIETYTIPWIKSGVPLTQIDPVPMPMFRQAPLAGEQTDTAEALLEGLQTSISPEPVGVLSNGSLAPVFVSSMPQGFVRRLGGNAATDFFYSGTFPSNGLRIGYIRIPTYNPSDQTAAIAQFQSEIAFFQNNTDGLVVDEMRNGGGVLCYGEAIVSNLIAKHWQPLGYEIRVTFDYLQSFGAKLSSARAGNNQETIDQYQTIYNAVLASFTGGQRRTDAVPLCGPSFDRAPATDNKGNVIAYGKPMIMLIDEFSNSTADGVPAMIQDNGRGLLVGWRTNGMGGSNSFNINAPRFPVGAYSEGDVGITLSLMVRKQPITTPDFPAASYIENIGVRPDVPIDYMTRDNLVNNGRSFVQAFTNIIVQQIQNGQ